MEFAAARSNKKWKKKRRNSKRRLRDRVKVDVEVMSTKHRRDTSGYTDTFNTNKTSAMSTMQADAFWKNYTAAQEWQRRHNVNLWRTRCMALEFENSMLREKIRLLALHPCCHDSTQANGYHKESDDEEEAQFNLDETNVECNLTEDMLSIIEQSERHRRELIASRESRKMKFEEESEECTSVIDIAERNRARKEQAHLLYGDASSKILAMETALQATMDNHKDKAQPQYWPNIPLKP